jgi:hypothetical protein
MPNPTPCPGPHNRAWRAAETLRTTSGTPHDLNPTWGEPLHCLGCAARAYRQLAELPELLAAVRLEADHGTRPKSTGTIGRIHIPAWPGQASRLMTDHILGAMTELEDDLRDLRHLGHRPGRGREGHTITGAVAFLTTHLDWALTHHPAAGEAHDRDSANPASQIADWNRAASRFTRRDQLRIQLAAPCPRCLLRTLVHEDGQEYIECRNPACTLLLSEQEYRSHAGLVAAVEQIHRAASA